MQPEIARLSHFRSCSNRTAPVPSTLLLLPILYLRVKAGSFLNPEDALAYGEQGTTGSAEPPEVECGLHAHRNDLESSLPFLGIGLIYRSLLFGGAELCLVIMIVKIVWWGVFA